MKKSAIPKIIHFIWVGGKLKKDTHKAYLTNWVRKNSNYQIWLWYDSEHVIAYDLGAQIRKKFKDNKIELDKHLVEASWAKGDKRLQMLGELLHESTGEKDNGIKKARAMLAANRQSLQTECPPGVDLKDVRSIVSELQNSFIYETEMVNRGGNFGAASDVLRVELLNKFGGVYSDLDLEAVKPFDDLMCLPHLGLVGEWNSLLSNALLGSHPRSLFTQRLISYMKQNYQQMKSAQAGGVNVDLDMYWDDIRGSTIKLTGPTVIRFICDSVAQQAMLQIKSEYERPRRFARPRTWTNPYGQNDGAQIWGFQQAEMKFPDDRVNFDTDEQKIHDWLVGQK